MEKKGKFTIENCTNYIFGSFLGAEGRERLLLCLCSMGELSPLTELNGGAGFGFPGSNFPCF